MERPSLAGLPRVPSSVQYVVRNYMPGDEIAWTDIQTEADQYNVIRADLFDQQFGSDPAALAARILIAVSGTGELVGTGAAWWGSSPEDLWGRAHWLAVRPSWQRQGIGRRFS